MKAARSNWVALPVIVVVHFRKIKMFGTNPTSSIFQVGRLILQGVHTFGVASGFACHQHHIFPGLLAGFVSVGFGNNSAA